MQNATPFRGYHHHFYGDGSRSDKQGTQYNMENYLQRVITAPFYFQFSRFNVDIIGQNYDLTLWFKYNSNDEIEYFRHDIQHTVYSGDDCIQDDSSIESVEFI